MAQKCKGKAAGPPNPPSLDWSCQNWTGELILADLCKWMDAHGSLATLRHGFKCYGRASLDFYFA